MVFSTPAMCWGIMEAPSYANIYSNNYNLVLCASVEAKPFFRICTTPVLSVNRFMHLPRRLDLTACTADNTASNSLAVEPVYYCSSPKVPRASIVVFACSWRAAVLAADPRWV